MQHHMPTNYEYAMMSHDSLQNLVNWGGAIHDGVAVAKDGYHLYKDIRGLQNLVNWGGAIKDGVAVAKDGYHLYKDIRGLQNLACTTTVMASCNVSVTGGRIGNNVHFLL